MVSFALVVRASVSQVMNSNALKCNVAFYIQIKNSVTTQRNATRKRTNFDVLNAANEKHEDHGLFSQPLVRYFC